MTTRASGLRHCARRIRLILMVDVGLRSRGRREERAKAVGIRWHFSNGCSLARASLWKGGHICGRGLAITTSKHVAPWKGI